MGALQNVWWARIGHFRGDPMQLPPVFGSNICGGTGSRGQSGYQQALREGVVVHLTEQMRQGGNDPLVNLAAAQCRRYLVSQSARYSGLTMLNSPMTSSFKSASRSANVWALAGLRSARSLISSPSSPDFPLWVEGDFFFNCFYVQLKRLCSVLPDRTLAAIPDADAAITIVRQVALLVRAELLPSHSHELFGKMALPHTAATIDKSDELATIVDSLSEAFAEQVVPIALPLVQGGWNRSHLCIGREHVTSTPPLL
jgi:hypothetical protein